MVNRGRPSKDCAPCRRRKLRCDLRKEGCGQCKRAGLSCFGYRDSEALIFHDQTEYARKKAYRIRHEVASSPTKQPRLSWTVIARQDFFSHYIFGLSRSYDMLGLLYGATRQGDHLDASVDAASLAFMAVRHSSAPNLIQQAAERYVTALQLVNRALATADVAVADDTLQSVLLLDLYEKLVSRNPQSATSWLQHMNGAIALIQMRGEKNLQTYVGRRLAQRLYTTLVISCGVAGVRVPHELDGLKEKLDSIYRNEDPKWCVTKLNVQAINLMADINEGRHLAKGEIATEAKRLDDQFRELQESLPASWQSTRVMQHGAAVQDHLVHSDGYDVYDNLFYTQVWNVIRILRIHLRMLIQRYSDAADMDTIAACTEVIKTSVNEICASTTQFLAPGTSPDNNTTPFSLAQSLKCYTLLAPLYLAARVSGDESTRSWVKHVLNYMAETGGLEMAHRTVQALETTPAANFWDVYAMLGSYAFAA